MKKIIFSILTISFLCSCEMTMDNGKIANLNENLTTNSYLIFGAYHGECLGEDCVEIYKIENNELFKDTLDIYPAVSNLPYGGSYVKLGNEYYEIVKSLLDNIPKELENEENIIIGQPDSHDQGGILIEIVIDGEKKDWLIDNDKDNVPEYLHLLIDSINSKIQRLSDFENENYACLSDTVSLPYNDTLFNEACNYWISFDSLINDSRCPVDVYCVWEGNAKVKLSFSENNNLTEFSLNTHIGFNKDTLINGYLIELLDVSPYPAINIKYSLESYTVRLLVKKNQE